jgi:hypothetical protein
MSDNQADWALGALMMLATVAFAALVPAMLWFEVLP